MRRRRALRAMLLALLALTALAGPAAAVPAGDSVTVTLERDRIDTVLGDRITFGSRVANRGRTPTGTLIAHVDVESLTGEVYVDPEDWSGERTVEVRPLQPGESAAVPWSLQAVNSGRFVVYVVVLPTDPASLGAESLVTSPPIRVDVAGRRTLDVGLALPVVVTTPVVLGLLIVAVRRRLRLRG